MTSCSKFVDLERITKWCSLTNLRACGNRACFSKARSEQQLLVRLLNSEHADSTKSADCGRRRRTACRLRTTPFAPSLDGLYTRRWTDPKPRESHVGLEGRGCRRWTLAVCSTQNSSRPSNDGIAFETNQHAVVCPHFSRFLVHGQGHHIDMQNCRRGGGGVSAFVPVRQLRLRAYMAKRFNFRPIDVWMRSQIRATTAT